MILKYFIYVAWITPRE